MHLKKNSNIFGFLFAKSYLCRLKAVCYLHTWKRQHVIRLINPTINNLNNNHNGKFTNNSQTYWYHFTNRLGRSGEGANFGNNLQSLL